MIGLVTAKAKGPIGEWLFGKYLDWLREEGGSRSQAEFAKYLGINRVLLNQYLNGRQKPSKANVEKLASLGPEIYDLVGMERPDPDLARLERIFELATQEQRDAIIVYAVRLIGDVVDET